MKKDIDQILKFLHQAEKLKTVLRHSWLSSGRRESTAEHTWRMALMAMVLYPHLEKKNRPDLSEVLQMVLVHDLCEVYAGDHWAFNKAKFNKHAREKKALQRVLKHLAPPTAKKIMGLWLEFEAGKTKEAKFARALDKIDVTVQHNESDIKTWHKKEYKFNITSHIKYVEYDKFLNGLSDLVKAESIKKYKKYKINPELYL